MKRPRIAVRPADKRYPFERTAEIVFANGEMGLITVRIIDMVPVIELHGLDKSVRVRVYPQHLHPDSLPEK